MVRQSDPLAVIDIAQSDPSLENFIELTDTVPSADIRLGSTNTCGSPSNESIT